MSVGAAIIGSSVLSAGASLIAGGQQAGAARDAAALQAEATRESVAEQRRQFDLTRADFAPWRDTGVAALNRLSAMFLGTDGPGTTGASGGQTQTGTRTEIVTPASSREETVWDPYLGQQGGYGTKHIPIPAVTREVPVYAPANDNAMLAPDYSEFFKSPGYQFRFDEGLRALDRSASARGRLTTPGYGRELTRYGQEYATNEFNAYADRLAGLAGSGQSATGSTAAAGAGAANAISGALQSGAAGQANALLAAGTARASGYVGAANSANAGIQNYLFYNWLNRPQAAA
jgi:hypothetical protein